MSHPGCGPAVRPERTVPPADRAGGVFLAMKGPDCADEVKEANNAVMLLGGVVSGTGTYTVPGTDIAHAVVKIRKNGVTNAKYPAVGHRLKASRCDVRL